MPGNPEVLALLEKLLESHQTPEEVCRERPDLLAEVKRRWREFRLIDAEIEELFPAKEALEEIDAGVRAHLAVHLANTPSGHSGNTPFSRLPAIHGYEVESVLGHGGMGIVYKARHLRLNRSVALKMLRSGPYAAPRELARFQLEAEAIACLSHENIVQVHDVGDFEGRPYLTMEFMEGGSLAQKIAGAQQPARAAASLVSTLANAVQTAHDGGIIHRDLKPGNILLNSAGIAKISDFGLARRLDGEDGPTLSGALLGTPSYMAPEQARGRSRSIGPAVDIYALGAILYELLTGRPPFRAETTSETVLEVLTQEPLPPSRLNSRVPRDLEIICLKCLRKEPEHRYSSASGLAEDLDRFLHGEAIMARPERQLERFLRRIRRRPALAVTLTALLLLSVALVGGGGWLWWERAANDMAQAQLARVSRMQRDREFLGRLDDIRLNRTVLYETSFEDFRNAQANKAIADRAYEAAFRDALIAQVGDKPEEIAARLAASTMRESLAAAIDDWAACAADPMRRRWLLAIAEPAGLDPTGLRKRLREEAINESSEAMTALAEEALTQQASVRLLVFLAERLRDAGGNAVPILARVQQDHTADFWANFMLADMLFHQGRFPESIRYFQAAAALRPEAAVVHNNLGRALAHDGKWDEAIVSLNRALAIDPTYAQAHSNLGLALRTKARYALALNHLEQAYQKAPENATFVTNLGVVLCDLGRYEEATKLFEKAVQIDSNSHLAHAGLAEIMERKGKLVEAIEQYRAALRICPTWASHHHRLGCVLFGDRQDGLTRAGGPNDQESREWGLRDEAVRKLGEKGAQKRLDDAMGHFQDALKLQPNYAPALRSMGDQMRLRQRFGEAIDFYEKSLRVEPNDKRGRLGMASALEELGRPAEAIEHLKCMVNTDPNSARAHYNLALTMAKYGLVAQAVESHREALRLDPSFADCHGALGMTLQKLGRFEEGKAELEQCLKLLPENDPRRLKIKDEATRCEQFRTMQTLLPDIVQGKKKLVNAQECLAFAQLCRIKKEYGAAVRLYREVFKLDPKLAAKLNGSRRYLAASSAALAGCGLGADELRATTEAERAAWRKQAREWLAADLLDWTYVVEGSRRDRNLTRTMLTHWLTNHDLDGVRGKRALAKFSDEEHREWDRIWFDHDQLLKRARELE